MDIMCPPRLTLILRLKVDILALKLYTIHIKSCLKEFKRVDDLNVMLKRNEFTIKT